LGIVQRLARLCGDEFEFRQYQRFSDLKVAEKSLARSSHQKDSYRNVQPGDCVVAFSRNDIFAIKREIELSTKYKCTVIYGSLPPQTRSEQARLFNDPNSGYDILVASDAVSVIVSI
jgi:ATP-dependent RNA helicase SUPV3L1/SUV3